MKSCETSGGGLRRSGPLLILNAVLLTAVVTLALTSRAGATAQPERPRGAYTMVSGQIQGGNTDMMYIIDSVNQELVAVTWDISKGNLRVVGHRNLATDSRQGGAR